MNLNLSLSLQEVNVVLNALSKLPFDQVAQTIAKIQSQASPQLETAKTAEAASE